MTILNNFNAGKYGENVACTYLNKNGWEILFRNYRRKSDEIDIIAKLRELLVFFEVKTLIKHSLSTLDALRPEDNLTSAKLRKIRRTCEFFARLHPELIDPDAGWQMDLLAIEISPEGKTIAIRHYKNI